MHRVLCGNVTYKDGKALGGINCQCNDADACFKSQLKVRQMLGVPAPVDRLTVIELKGKRGKGKDKGKGKGKGKDRAGKGHSQKPPRQGIITKW